MYEENSYKLKIDWKTLIIRAILVLLFIILVIWLFPMPKLDTFYNRIFNENMNTMSTAAKNYFNNNLPEDIGDTSTIKLEEMINKNLLIEFKDKNNESCNKTNSFAQITKTGTNEYVLKTQLSCQDETDYVLETLNTTPANTSSINTSNTTATDNQTKDDGNNTSNTTNTNIKNTINNDEDDDEDIIKDDVTYDKDGNIVGIIEYEFKKPIYSSTKSYYCPDGYVLDGKTCYKEETGETIEATKEYFEDRIETTDAKKSEGEKYTVKADTIKKVDKVEQVCPEGYTLNKNMCYKYKEATVNPGSTKYTCPSGYTLDGTKCVQTIDATKNTSTNTSYSCPNGGTLNGTKCNKQDSIAADYHNGSNSCSCPNGGHLNGTRCEKEDSINADYHNGTTSCSCPSGYSPSGSSCTRTTSYGASASGYWTNPTTQTSKTPLSEYNNGKQKRWLGSKSCNARGCTYTYYVSNYVTSYSCPNGGSLSGSTCYKTETAAQNCSTTSGYYTCSRGNLRGDRCYYDASYNASCSSSNGYYTCSKGTLNGNRCYYDASYDATKNDSSKTTYTCPSGYEQKDDKCTKTIDATKNTTETTYTCPEGYTKEGTTCYITAKPEEKITYKYSCPEGFTATGEGEKMTCSKEMQNEGKTYCEDADATLDGDKCIKKIIGAFKGYSCPDGYILNGDKCTKKTTSCMSALVDTSTSVSYKYTWSRKKTLDGWTPTGKTRTVKSTQLIK